MPPRLPAEPILDMPAGEYPAESIGTSRDGRAVRAVRLGSGPLRISLIAGCHADEPVGPAMLERLAAHLSALDPAHELLSSLTWYLVPHANPDGDRRNERWSRETVETEDHRGEPDQAFRLLEYARHVIRERPGDDMEFGFPRSAEDLGARPENRAIADFLRPGAPFAVHGSLHGMAFAPGPWFLIEREWIERTTDLRERLRRRVSRMGYGLLDWDRGGDKGFERIDEGFSTRPDSGAMRRHFLDLGDAATAELFRPSSMEYVRSLGGDPFTFVSEMPLFLHPDPAILAGERDAFRQWFGELMQTPAAEAQRAIERAGIRAMPIRDQMQLQLAFVQEAIDCADRHGSPDAA